MTTPTLAEALRLILLVEGAESKSQTAAIARNALAAHDAQPAPVAAVQAEPFDAVLFNARVFDVIKENRNMIAHWLGVPPIAQAAQRAELLIQLNGMIDVAERFARHMHKRGDTDERDLIQRAINAARASIEGAAKP